MYALMDDYNHNKYVYRHAVCTLGQNRIIGTRDVTCFNNDIAVNKMENTFLKNVVTLQK